MLQELGLRSWAEASIVHGTEIDGWKFPAQFPHKEKELVMLMWLLVKINIYGLMAAASGA